MSLRVMQAFIRLGMAATVLTAAGCMTGGPTRPLTRATNPVDNGPGWWISRRASVDPAAHDYYLKMRHMHRSSGCGAVFLKDKYRSAVAVPVLLETLEAEPCRGERWEIIRTAAYYPGPDFDAAYLPVIEWGLKRILVDARQLAYTPSAHRCLSTWRRLFGASECRRFREDILKATKILESGISVVKSARETTGRENKTNEATEEN